MAILDHFSPKRPETDSISWGNTHEHNSDFENKAFLGDEPQLHVSGDIIRVQRGYGSLYKTPRAW